MDLNVLIVGGGIHGAGLLHDLATRQVKGIHLVEQNRLASGTSSRTTKLVHGGLRYLEHPSQWGLVREALRERGILLRNLPGIVRPIPFVLPNFRGGRPPWLVRTGLTLYDLLDRVSGLPSARRLTHAELAHMAPYLRPERIAQEMRSAFLFYDAQMRDDVIVRLAVRAATRLGATYQEETRVEDVIKDEKGFCVKLASSRGPQEVTTKVIVNAAGSWCNANLLRWGVTPRVPCLLTVGSHLLFRPEAVPARPEDCAATLLQHEDGRVVFFIPWEGKWLLGTTESTLTGTPEQWECPAGDRDYLLQVAAVNLDLAEPERHIDEFFCGIRTFPLRASAPATAGQSAPGIWRENPFASPFYTRRPEEDVSSLSREAVVDEVVPNLLTIYGGKFTTYRALCEGVGNRLADRLACARQSGTRERENWFLDELRETEPGLFHSYSDLRHG